MCGAVIKMIPKIVFLSFVRTGISTINVFRLKNKMLPKIERKRNYMNA